MNNINFNQGTLSFHIPEGVLDYGDNKFVYLINYVSKEGHLKIVKNKNNGIVVDYLYKDFGKCKLEVNADDLDNEQEHRVIVMWSIGDGFLKLNINEKERKSCEIDLD